MQLIMVKLSGHNIIL